MSPKDSRKEIFALNTGHPELLYEVVSSRVLSIPQYQVPRVTLRSPVKEVMEKVDGQKESECSLLTNPYQFHIGDRKVDNNEKV